MLQLNLLRDTGARPVGKVRKASNNGRAVPISAKDADPAAAEEAPKPPTAKRYGWAVLFVAIATVASFPLESATGRFATFPFYAAVVGSAWFGFAPGVLSFTLSVLIVAFWTPTRFSLTIEAAEWPAFAAFVLCALMSFAWSSQRRRAQQALERTVQQRTSDLVTANAALKAEIAERQAAEDERRRAEQALREAEAELARTLRLATMAELAAAIAHEINQPLAAITANGGACLRSLERNPPLLDTAREAAGCVVADGHRAGEVIARIRALFNKEQPRWQMVDINDVIQRVLGLTRVAIERDRITVQTELVTPAPRIMGDPVQLQQVIFNMVTNAIEAMSGARCEPLVLTIRSETDESNLGVSIEDTGPGLSAEQAIQIFDSFYTTKPGGIGVGLAISRSIIEAHGGKIWAKPHPERGAHVGFTLPLREPSPECGRLRRLRAEAQNGQYRITQQILPQPRGGDLAQKTNIQRRRGLQFE